MDCKGFRPVDDAAGRLIGGHQLRQLERHQFGACLLEMAAEPLHVAGDGLVNLQAHDADPRAGHAVRDPRRKSDCGNLQAAGIGGVVAGDGLQDQREILRGAREWPGDVERPAVRQDARPADQAEARLQSQHSAGSGRQADRSSGIRAEGEHGEACGERRAGSGGGAAGIATRVPGIARRRIGQVEMHGAGAGAVFPGVELAEEDGALRLQSRDRGCRPVRHMVEQQAGSRAGPARPW